ncbi:MAG: anion transporter [Pseudomonadota bacterium]
MIVYLGLALGRLPGLALDRTGVALLGAIALIALGYESLDGPWQAVDLPTLALLFGLMVLSAQFRLGGFYTFVVKKLAGADLSPRALLGWLILTAGGLSAVLANDIVCLAMAPVLIDGCGKRGLDPKPFLLALACASNVGSAATLIGNPQNMLIGQVLHLSFVEYSGLALPPSLIGLGLIWLVISRCYKGSWQGAGGLREADVKPFDAWQTGKGLAVLSALVLAFLFSPLPREIAALAAGGILLCSRKMRSREMLGLVDWQLLLLFICLFVVNHTLKTTGELDRLAGFLNAAGVRLEQPIWLFGLCLPLSNLVSNVPAVMLLLPYASHPLAGPVLALSSTLAGNLLIVGSIANIIVVDQAARLGVALGWAEHARVGVPVTLATSLVAGLWLYLVAA